MIPNSSSPAGIGTEDRTDGYDIAISGIGPTELAGADGTLHPSDRERYRRSRAWLRAARRPSNVLALLVIFVILLWALWPGLFASQNPDVGSVALARKPPSWEHLFGTDELGRDVFSRVVYGTRVSVVSAALAVMIGLAVGAIVGLLAGFRGGWLDDLLMRTMDLLLAIPGLILAMAIITAWGSGTTKVAFAVGVGSVATIARTMRSEVVKVRTADYVDAARSSGSRWPNIVVSHILPNSWAPVAVLAVIQFGIATLAIASLSFLGFGAPPPAPEWGEIVADGSDYLATAWWITTLPGLIIIALVVSLNHLARGRVYVGGRR